MNNEFEYLDSTMYEDKNDILMELDRLIEDIKHQKENISNEDTEGFYLNYLIESPHNYIQMALLLSIVGGRK